MRKLASVQRVNGVYPIEGKDRIVLDRTGVTFRDEDSVRADYDEGRDVFDVIDEIVAEYE